MTDRPLIPPVDGPPVTRETSPALLNWFSSVQDRINRLLQGKANVSAATTVTLRANQTTTTLIDNRIGYFSVVIFEPVTADAANIGRPGMWHETSDGSATIHHVSDASTTMTFSYAVLG